MSGKLDGKIALVTGASRGIGRGIALRLASDGATVIVNYASAADAAAEVVGQIKAGRGVAQAIQADVADLDSIAAMFEQIDATHRRVDILINNAGRRMDVHPLLIDTTPEAYDHIFALNARGLFFVTQAAVRLMPENGRIVNVSSAATTRKLPGLSIYSGSKAAVEAFTRVWATEFAPRGITVNSILPGAVETDLLRKNRDDGSYLEHLRSLIPMGRLGQPGDIADAIAFLVSEDARWITGQTILATGGA